MPEYGEISVLSDKTVDMQTCCLFTEIKKFFDFGKQHLCSAKRFVPYK